VPGEPSADYIGTGGRRQRAAPGPRRAKEKGRSSRNGPVFVVRPGAGPAPPYWMGAVCAVGGSGKGYAGTTPVVSCQIVPAASVAKPRVPVVFTVTGSAEAK
jgi:hypothetical protein